MKWFWLSFADGSRPEGQQFLGVAIIPVDEKVTGIIEQLDHDDRIEAIRERGDDPSFFVAVGYASLLGVNPGGSVKGIEITEGIEKVPLTMRGTLLSREELREAGLIAQEEEGAAAAE